MERSRSPVQDHPSPTTDLSPYDVLLSDGNDKKPALVYFSLDDLLNDQNNLSTAAAQHRILHETTVLGVASTFDREPPKPRPRPASMPNGFASEKRRTVHAMYDPNFLLRYRESGISPTPEEGSAF